MVLGQGLLPSKFFIDRNCLPPSFQKQLPPDSDPLLSPRQTHPVSPPPCPVRVGCPPWLLLGLQPRAGRRLAGGLPACPSPCEEGARPGPPVVLGCCLHSAPVHMARGSNWSSRELQRPGPRPGGAHALRSVCTVTFQGWISASADRKQKRFCAERK